ncbi:hypothetical protein [Herbaspirillum huttiense]|uniref:hypothetical protein n=1 Tax=Herbaspirillum huttiense TaxID=863372 RepID=UPI0039AF30C7
MDGSQQQSGRLLGHLPTGVRAEQYLRWRRQRIGALALTTVGFVVVAMLALFCKSFVSAFPGGLGSTVAVCVALLGTFICFLGLRLIFEFGPGPGLKYARRKN